MSGIIYNEPGKKKEGPDNEKSWWETASDAVSSKYDELTKDDDEATDDGFMMADKAKPTTDWSKSMKKADGTWGGDERIVKSMQKSLGVKVDGKWGGDSVTAWEKANNKADEKREDTYDSKLDIDSKPQKAGFFSDIFGSSDDKEEEEVKKLPNQNLQEQRNNDRYFTTQNNTNKKIFDGRFFEDASEEDIGKLQEDIGAEVTGKWTKKDQKLWMSTRSKGDLHDIMEGMTEKEQLDRVGITWNMLNRSGLTKGLREWFASSISPTYYDIEMPIKAFIDQKKDYLREGFDKKVQNKGEKDKRGRYDAQKLSAGLPQEFNTFTISNHMPGSDNEPYPFTFGQVERDVRDDTTYYAYADRKDFINRMMGQIDTIVSNKKSNPGHAYQSGYMGGVTNSAGAVVLDMGEDKHGKFISYYDKNDYMPDGGIIAKPFKIYDKVYVKKVGNHWMYEGKDGKWRKWRGRTTQTRGSKRATKNAIARDAANGYTDPYKIAKKVSGLVGDIVKSKVSGYTSNFFKRRGGIIYKCGGGKMKCGGGKIAKGKMMKGKKIPKK